MFNKNKFAQILKNISETYDSQREFSKKSEINRTYLSQYMNMKLDDPPTPKILEKVAKASNGITTYAELMDVCGYLETINYNEIEKNEFDKVKSQLYNRGFSQEQINKITDYCMKKFIGKDPSSEKYLDEFENFLNTLNPEDAKFVLDFKTNIALNVAKKYTRIADKTHSIINKSNEILNEYDDNTFSQFYRCPVYGQIAAGQPIFVEEYLEGYLPVDPNIYGLSTAEDLFYLRVSGQSMNLKIKNGDYALIRKQDYAEDGDIVVAIVNGDDEATLKKYKKLNEQFVLLEPMSSDPTIEAITVDLKSTNFKIIGKAIGHFGKF